MKKLLTLSVAAMLAVTAFGQGTVTFNTRDTANSLLAPVTDTDGVTLVAGTGFRIALLGGPTTATPAVVKAGSPAVAGTLSLLASPVSGTTWVAANTGTRAGYANVGTDTPRTVPGVDFGGNTATLQLVAWAGTFTDWASAVADWNSGSPNAKIGASATWNVKTGADAIAFPPVNTGMSGFSLVPVPEPSTMALAGLGAAALLIFRRRK